MGASTSSKLRRYKEKSSIGGTYVTAAQINNRIERTTFKNKGNGEWTTDETPFGGAQILEASDASGRKIYEVRVWDADNNMAPVIKMGGSLNDAKYRAKKELKRNLMKALDEGKI